MDREKSTRGNKIYETKMLKIWERGEEEFKISILSGEERNNRK